MTKDYPEIAGEASESTARLRQSLPEVMKGYGQMAEAALAGGALDQKTKELMALAISCIVRCDGCISLHTHAARRAGATREEVAEAVGVAVFMGGGPAVIRAAEALDAYDQFDGEI
jgi:AhpD family alkylhydroperoxidase